MSVPQRLVVLALLLLMSGCHVASAADSIEPVTPGALHEDVLRLRGLVAACTAASAACDAGKVGADQRIAAGSGSYEVHWQWLRDALQQAHDKPSAKEPDTTTLLQAADARLQAMLSSTDPTAADEALQQRARRKADEVLAQPEFVREGPTWWERFKARLQRWLFSLFEGVGRVGAMAPWLGKAIEWGLFFGAVVGLVVFLMRSLARQRLRVAMNAGSPAIHAWDRDAEDWQAQAERAAAAGDWREAVHCLYWAAIVLLEGRRAWRHNPTRTPREYVRLLKPGSTDREALRDLTRTFERVWYGLGAADATVYGHAQQDFARLGAGARAEEVAA